MPLTDKALRLKRYRELKEIFKDNKDVLDIRKYDNYKEAPFGHVLYIRNGLDLEHLTQLKNYGFIIVGYKNIKHNNEIINEVWIWKHPIEKQYYNFFFQSGITSFKEWENSSFYKKSKEIGSQEYYRVLHEIVTDEKKEYTDKHLTERTKTSQLTEELEKLKEENYKLTKQILELMNKKD